MKDLLLKTTVIALGAGLMSSVVSLSALAQTPLTGNTPPLASHIAPTNHPPEVAAVSPNTAAVRIVLSISDRTVSLFKGDTLSVSYPVAVGSAETPTPLGEFSVSQMVVEPIWQSPWTGELHAPGANSALGLRWIGFTTTTAGSFGFHGTPTLNSIGKAVSNGCVRMRNEDVVALFEQVDVGTPVTVVP